MSKDEEKIQKPAKAPGALRKPIKKKRFVNRFEKMIEHQQDRKFFVSCFDERDEIFYIREGLTKDDVKKLKGLVKVIKANRKGAINAVPILFASGFIAFLVIFFTIFANPILGSLLEKGLEAAFEAKSDVRGFRLSLIKFEISVKNITVANKDKPMTNLFEMGGTGIKLRPAAVLRGKIYIEWIKAETIRFGTERKYSGAIPGRPPKPKKEKPPKPDSPPLIDLKNFDAMALVNNEFDKLNTPKLYDIAINTYNETSQRWQKQVDDSSARVKELQTASAPLLSLNVNNLRDIEAAKNAISDINKMVTTVQAATNDVNTIVNGLESDIKTAQGLEANARNSIADDFNLLKSYLDLGSGAAFSAIEPYIRDMLSDTAQQYIDYGLIALDVLGQLKAQSSQPKPAKQKKEKKEKKVVFKGRDVHFPVVAYPAFYLGLVKSDFTHSSWNWSLDLRNISSNPDFTGHSSSANGPVTLALGLKEDGGNFQRSVGFNGSADFRSNSQERFSAEVKGNNFPLSIGDQFGGIGIKGFRGDVDFSVNMGQKVSSNVSAGGNVIVRQAQLVEPQGTIAEAVGIAVKEAGNINLGIQYANDKLSLSTNIGELFAKALRQTAELYIKKAIADLEDALRKKVDEYIDGKFASKEQVDALINIAKGDRAIIDKTREALYAKIRELQGQGEQAARQALDDASKKAEDAARQAKEEAERRAKEEAQKKAGEAAKNLLPGLSGRR